MGEGVAFLAAGIVFFQKGTVKGLTTGAGLWLSGAIGLTIGLVVAFAVLLVVKRSAAVALIAVASLATYLAPDFVWLLPIMAIVHATAGHQRRKAWAKTILRRALAFLPNAKS